MTRPSLRITERQVGDITVLDLTGLLVLDDGDAVFRDSVNDLINRERLRMVVNLADVTYIDSAGIGVLIGRYLGVRRRGGDMPRNPAVYAEGFEIGITQGTVLHVFIPHSRCAAAGVSGQTRSPGRKSRTK